MLTSKFNNFYRSIIKQDTDKPVNETAKKEKTTSAKQEQEVTTTNSAKTENDNGVKTLEKNFLDKFIRYNELQMLMKDLPQIANSFKSIQGFDEQLIRDTVEKLLADRQKQIDTLTKDLTELRDKITKEAEVANYKKSVIDIFDNQSKNTEPTSPYGYMAKNNNGDAFNNGETIAAQDGVPTVSVGMPEVTDDTPNAMMNSEELPVNADTQPAKVDDLKQAIEKDADTVEVPQIPKQTGKLTKTRLKSLERKNLDKSNVLIDSKKTKKSKK